MSILTRLLLLFRPRTLYPKILLPQRYFKKIDADLSNHHICRVSFENDYLELDGKNIKDKALARDDGEFFDYSTNHLGQFELSFNNISICGDNKKLYTSYWDYKTIVKVPAFKRDFIHQDNKIFFFKIGDIKGLSFPFKNGKQQEDSVRANVIHTPTNCNYWHFSIVWVNNAGDIVKKNKSAWQQALIATLRARLLNCVMIDSPEPILIEKVDYTFTDTYMN